MQYQNLEELRTRIVFTGSLFQAMVSMVFNYQKYHDMKRWKDMPLVEAEILDCSPEIIDGDTFIPYVKVDYAGRVAEFSAVKAKRNKSLRVGSKLVLLYDVSNPSQSIDLEKCPFLEVAEVCRV